MKMHFVIEKNSRETEEGIPADDEEFIILFNSTLFLSREMRKCRRLVSDRPVDMSQYNEVQLMPSGGMSVLSQIVLSTCRQLAPDWNLEEFMIIDRESAELRRHLDEMQQYIPGEEHRLYGRAQEAKKGTEGMDCFCVEGDVSLGSPPFRAIPSPIPCPIFPPLLPRDSLPIR
ncbi:unnamed protein product [Darwinula stevensoni]|uniref:Uncharacterized protein n=1 Tax=Darwinula stevensoni TaxID=69355 RepID=A0A7R9AD72_9CRUS|nr:unnamed protein product [Darwinula stevensoni]CAG0901022.1 unnamed protein product [Darwinula stevensoni]